MLAQKQSQIKAAEKLSAKLNGKNISEVLKGELNNANLSKHQIDALIGKTVKAKDEEGLNDQQIINLVNLELPLGSQSIEDQLQSIVQRSKSFSKDDEGSKDKSTCIQISLTGLDPQKLKQTIGDSESKSLQNDFIKELKGTAFENIEEILNSNRFKGYKNKNQLTIEPYSEEQIEFFRLQEAERYKHPQKPWIYLDHKGKTSIVGPVVKKNKNGAQAGLNNKPRDHPQLKQDRPGIITLLCLARDAASRLPDGIGTRADILELIKHSQWLKQEGIDYNQLNNIVSGALDRLHYEQDPCVKYGSDNKIWIYLHKDRTLDFLDWKSCPDPVTQVYAPNCLENNCVCLDMMIEKFSDSLIKRSPKRIKENWTHSEHREKQTEELESLLKKQKQQEEAFAQNQFLKEQTELEKHKQA